MTASQRLAAHRSGRAIMQVTRVSTGSGSDRIMGNPGWYRAFKLEVTNTSNKPIYFLELWLKLNALIANIIHSTHLVDRLIS